MPNDSYTTLFNTLPVVFFLTDTQGTVVYANERIEERTGFQVPEVVGKRPGDLWGGSMPKKFYRELWRTIQTRERPFIGEVRNQKKNGDAYSERMHVAPVRGERGEVQYFLGMNPISWNAHFSNAFYAVMKQSQKNTRAVTDWIETLGFRSGYGGNETCCLAELFHTALVLPTQERFANRNDDHTLLLAVTHDVSAFGALYQKYRTHIYAYVLYRVHRNHTLAEDITQETFLKAFSHRDLFVPSNASYLTYLRRIAHNLIVDHLRKHSAVLPTDDLISTHLRQFEADVYENQDMIHRALYLLTTVEQRIIRMKYHEGLRIHDIAAELGKTENAVKLHLSRARAKMREHIGA